MLRDGRAREASMPMQEKERATLMPQLPSHPGWWSSPACISWGFQTRLAGNPWSLPALLHSGMPSSCRIPMGLQDGRAQTEVEHARVFCRSLALGRWFPFPPPKVSTGISTAGFTHGHKTASWGTPVPARHPQLSNQESWDGLGHAPVKSPPIPVK